MARAVTPAIFFKNLGWNSEILFSTARISDFPDFWAAKICDSEVPLKWKNCIQRALLFLRTEIKPFLQNSI